MGASARSMSRRSFREARQRAGRRLQPTDRALAISLEPPRYARSVVDVVTPEFLLEVSLFALDDATVHHQ